MTWPVEYRVTITMNVMIVSVMLLAASSGVFLEFFGVFKCLAYG